MPERPVTFNKHAVFVVSAGGNVDSSASENSSALENSSLRRRNYLVPYLEDVFSLVGFTTCSFVEMYGCSRKTRQETMHMMRGQVELAVEEVHNKLMENLDR